MQANSQELQAVEQAEAHLVDDTAEFFAPVSTDLVHSLVQQYQAARDRIHKVAEIFTDPDNSASLSYFLEGNGGESGRHTSLSVSDLFKVEGAICALNAGSWAKLLSYTDVLDAMPQARRDAWNAQLRAWKEPRYKRGANPELDLPDFEEETVRATLQSMLAMRATYFAERVDGVFRGLSGRHVTNTPEGFNRRMILAQVIEEYGAYARHQSAGLINDLRCVIARFMGRDEPRYTVTSSTITSLARAGKFGEWVALDGGALRIRIYKDARTCHVEISPELVFRLNGVLAQLYPLAIPPQFRRKPAKVPREFRLMGRPLPFQVIEAFCEGTLKPGKTEGVVRTFSFSFSAATTSGAHAEARRVLESLGGIPARNWDVDFDYAVDEALEHVIRTGMVPDDVSHNFYPSPEIVGQVAVDMADIGPEDSVCEPSAGRGDLAALVPGDTSRVVCVEISALRCAVLRARGFDTVHDDFIAWAAREHARGRRFARLLGNPPFSEGRAIAHLKAAATLVAPGGRLSFVLPASQRGKDLLPGWTGEWSEPIHNEFAGTSVSVAIYAAQAPV